MSNISDAKAIYHIRITSLQEDNWITNVEEDVKNYSRRVSLEGKLIDSLKTEDASKAVSDNWENFKAWLTQTTSNDDTYSISKAFYKLHVDQEYLLFFPGPTTISEEGQLPALWIISLADEHFPDLVRDVTAALTWIEGEGDLPDGQALGPMFAEVLFDEFSDYGKLAHWMLGLPNSKWGQRRLLEILLLRLEFFVAIADAGTVAELMPDEHIIFREEMLSVLLEIVTNDAYMDLRDLVPDQISQIIVDFQGKPALLPQRVVDDEKRRNSTAKKLTNSSNNDYVEVGYWLRFGRWPGVKVKPAIMLKALAFFITVIPAVLLWFPVRLISRWWIFGRFLILLEHWMSFRLNQVSLLFNSTFSGSFFWPWPLWPILCFQGPVAIKELYQIIPNADLPDTELGSTECYISNHDVNWTVCRVSDRTWIPIVTVINARGIISIKDWPGPHGGESNQSPKNTPDPKPPGEGGNVDYTNYQQIVDELENYENNGVSANQTWHADGATLAHEMAHWKIDWIETCIKGQLPFFLQQTARMSVTADDAVTARQYLEAGMTQSISLYTLLVTQAYVSIATTHRPGDGGAAYKAGQKFLDKIIDKIKAIAQNAGWPPP